MSSGKRNPLALKGYSCAERLAGRGLQLHTNLDCFRREWAKPWQCSPIRVNTKTRQYERERTVSHEDSGQLKGRKDSSAGEGTGQGPRVSQLVG